MLLSCYAHIGLFVLLYVVIVTLLFLAFNMLVITWLLCASFIVSKYTT